MHATRIVAIRHGETAWNVDTRIQGHLDIPLNDTGLWQAEQAAKALAGEPIAAIYTSDLQRAHATAQAVARTTGAPLVTDTGLRERSFGHFQGRTFAEIEAELPEDALRWRKRDPHYAPEGGESLVTLRERIARTVTALAPMREPGDGRPKAFRRVRIQGMPENYYVEGYADHFPVITTLRRAQAAPDATKP